MPIPAAGILTIDPAHSSIGVHVRHLMIAKVTGRFRTFSGMIPVEPDPEESWAEVSVDAASIDTADPQRDQHLRPADFLDAERFPTIEFRSTDLRRKHGKAFDVARRPEDARRGGTSGLSSPPIRRSVEGTGA
jgi:polyisoprenoid-binding protein YceI